MAVMMAAGAALPAQTVQKVAIINIQQAILGTKEGQKAAADLSTKFDPKRKELEGKQGEIRTKQQQLQAGSNTMGEEARTKLTREIDQLTKALNREAEDYQALLDGEQQKALGELLQKIQVVVQRYAKDNNIGVVLDVSQQVNILYFSDASDITQDIVALYDRSSSVMPSSGPAAAPAKPTAAPKPAKP
jgi:outer membrane protein